MPTYDYRCNGCGHEFELFQAMSASPKRKCPECGAMKLERLIGTGAAVLFKGSGFYETDYRSDSYKKAAEKDKAPAKSDSGKGDSSSASKSKTETKTSAGADKQPAKKPAKDTKK